MHLKKMICLALALIAAGLLLSLGAMSAMDFNYTEMNSMKLVTNTYMIDDAFTSLSIKGAECDIRLLLAEDSKCKVVCTEGYSIHHTVSVQNGTLTVERVDARRWYEHVGIYWGRMEIALYLPRTQYDSLTALSVSGDIDIPDDFSFSQAELQSTSGAIDCFAAVEGTLSLKTTSGGITVGETSPESLKIKSTSGDVELRTADIKTSLQIKTVSGEISAYGVTCQSVEAESTSGEISFHDLVAAGNAQLKTVSGKISLLLCDAASLSVKTTSGRVFATFLSDKIFLAKTTSGAINVPFSTKGGMCEIITTSGSITCSIEAS